MKTCSQFAFLRRAVCALTVVLMTTFAPAAHAQIDFDIDGEIIGVVDAARIGFNTLSPITVFANNGTFATFASAIHHNATLDMSGGTIGELNAYDASKINVSGGYLGLLYTNDSSVANLSANGGMESARTFGDSVLNISGGNIDSDILAFDRSAISVSGGQIGRIEIVDDSSLFISGGTITNSSESIEAFGNGHITMTGGDNIYGGFITGESSAALITAGSNGFISSGGSSVVTITGGETSFFVSAGNDSQINIRGGSVALLTDPQYAVYDSGVLCFFGNGLSATLIDPDYFGVSRYSLSGFLEDGTSLTGYDLNVANNGFASFKFINSVAAVPEPGMVAFGVMAAGGVLGMIARKRK